MANARKRETVFAVQLDRLPRVTRDELWILDRVRGFRAIDTIGSSIPEVVIDGATGLLVRPDDAVALATAIESLLANPTRARELGEAGRARVLDSFSVGRMAERTIAVYESVSGVMVDATGVVG